MTPLDGRPGAGPLSAMSFPEQFSDQVRLTPGQTAIRDENRSLTFEALNIASAAVAARLRAMGLGESTAPDHYDINHPEQAAVSPWVLVITGRTVDVAIAILGVLRAGGAYILMPAGAPDAYISQIIDTAKVSAVLTDDPRVRFEAPCIYLGDDLVADADPDLVKKSLKFVPRPLDMATAIFTSGSTGRPKGAVLEHRSVSAMLAWQKSYMRLDPGEHTAAFAPLGFIAAPWELLYPLAAGMTLHILSESVRRDPLALEAYFSRHAVRYVFLSPEMAELFSHNCRGESLRYVRVAGGPLRSCPETPYEILYSLGMSENGGSVTFLSIRQAYEGTIPLGRAFGPTRIYLVDDENRVVTPGETGKMAVSSPSLARGYLAMPEENAGHFVSNTYNGSQVAICNGSSNINGDGQAYNRLAYDRLFISGDLARVDDHGMLVYEGRQDFMVKIRGMRVDPGHTEAALAGCEGVAECIVTAKENPDQGHCLWAWATGDGLDALGLQEKLKGLLPGHMVPERIMVMDELPRGVNGKIDRSGLPEIPPETSGSYRIDSDTERDPVLERVCALFARILHVPMVHPMDNFFVSGGDSLKLARLQLLLRSEWSVDMPYSRLFRHPTPTGVLELLGSVKRNALVSPIPKAPAQPQYALTPPMRQMFLLWRLGTDPRAYEVDTCMMIEGDVDGDRLEKAFAALVSQQPVLRSRFIEQGGEPAWVMDASVHYTLEHLRASDLEAAKAVWAARNTRRQPFDLNEAPLFFAARIDMEDGGCFAGLATHHILADAASLRILLDEWWDLYTRRAAVPDKPLSMADVIVWEQEQANREINNRLENYWKQEYDTQVAPLVLPGTAPRPDTFGSGSGVVCTRLDRDQVSALASFAQALNLTVFQVLLAVWAAFLSKTSDRTQGFDEVVIGVPFAGRDHPDLLNCVGMFVRTLPVRFRPETDGSQTFADWLSIVRDKFLKAWDHQSCSLERIVRMVNPPRIPGRNPLYDVMINRFPEPAPFQVLEENGEQTTAAIVQGNNRPALFDLVFDIREEDGGILLELNYSRDLFQADLVLTWVESIAAVAVAAAAFPEMRLCDASWPVTAPTIKPLTVKDRIENPNLSTPCARWDTDAPEVQALLTIWKQVLNVENPGPDDDFFEQGGDSIKAMRLESKLFKAGWYLPATEIYDRAKLGDLMERVTDVAYFDDEEDEFA